MSEADGKRPIAGRPCRVGGGLAPPRDWEEDATRNEAVTDAGGRFRLEGIGRVSLTVAARAPGFARAERHGVRAGDRVELFLFPGATLSGTVRDDAGRPVTGAVVRAEGGGLWSAAPPAERTDARGAFVMPGVDAGDYVLVAREGGRAPAVATAVVEAGSDASVSLTLSDGGFATGRIVDDSGRPLAGRVRVEVFEDRGLPAFASELLTSETKSDGQFVLGPLPLGRLGLVASAAGHASRPLEAEVPARGRTADLGDVTLETGLSIRGRVADRDGEGIAGATVVASGLAGDRSRFEATSEADGAFVVGGLRPGLYQVRARAAGYGAAIAKAEAGSDPVELVMEAGGQIAGSVVDAQGQPVEEARIEARATDTQSFDPGRSFSRQRRRGRGPLRPARRRLGDLRPRGPGDGVRRRLRDQRASDRRDARRARARSPSGAGGVVRGTVVDPEGQGIPGASVYADRDTNTRTSNYTSQTDSAGAFEIRGVPTGRFEVRAHHPSYAPGQGRRRRGGPGEGAGARPPRARPRRPPRGARAAPGRAAVRRRTGDGERQRGVRLAGAGRGRGRRLVRRGPPAAGHGHGHRHDLRGRSVRRPRAGRHQPDRHRDAGGRAARGRDDDRRDRAPRRPRRRPRHARLPARARASASASAWAPNATSPSRAGRDRSRSAVGPPPLAATTREDGSYELVVFTPGPGRVNLQSTTSPQAYPGREVAIPDVERYELDLEIADTTASGVVVDRETGDPVGDVRVSLRSVEPETRRRRMGVDRGRRAVRDRGRAGGVPARGRRAGPSARHPARHRGTGRGPGPARRDGPRARDRRAALDTAGRPAGGYPVTVTAAG